MSAADREIDRVQAMLEARTDLPQMPLFDRAKLLLGWCEELELRCELLSALAIEYVVEEEDQPVYRCQLCLQEIHASCGAAAIPHSRRCLVGAHQAYACARHAAYIGPRAAALLLPLPGDLRGEARLQSWDGAYAAARDLHLKMTEDESCNTSKLDRDGDGHHANYHRGRRDAARELLAQMAVIEGLLPDCLKRCGG